LALYSQISLKSSEVYKAVAHKYWPPNLFSSLWLNWFESDTKGVIESPWHLASVVSNVQVERMVSSHGGLGVGLICDFVGVDVESLVDTSGETTQPVWEEDLVELPCLVRP